MRHMYPFNKNHNTSNQITTVRTKTSKNTLLTKTYIQSTKILNLQKILNVISALLTKWSHLVKTWKILIDQFKDIWHMAHWLCSSWNLQSSYSKSERKLVLTLLRPTSSLSDIGSFDKKEPVRLIGCTVVKQSL